MRFAKVDAPPCSYCLRRDRHSGYEAENAGSIPVIRSHVRPSSRYPHRSWAFVVGDAAAAGWCAVGRPEPGHRPGPTPAVGLVIAVAALALDVRPKCPRVDEHGLSAACAEGPPA